MIRLRSFTAAALSRLAVTTASKTGSVANFAVGGFPI
jgi:hypothetical protein